jgi:hypothetical protein
MSARADIQAAAGGLIFSAAIFIFAVLHGPLRPRLGTQPTVGNQIWVAAVAFVMSLLFGRRLLSAVRKNNTIKRRRTYILTLGPSEEFTIGPLRGRGAAHLDIAAVATNPDHGEECLLEVACVSDQIHCVPGEIAVSMAVQPEPVEFVLEAESEWSSNLVFCWKQPPRAAISLKVAVESYGKRQEVEMPANAV